jgi:hypothetical protein
VQQHPVTLLFESWLKKYLYLFTSEVTAIREPIPKGRKYSMQRRGSGYRKY